MALRYIDSMGDHYTAAQATLKWTSTSGLIQRTTGVHGYGLIGRLGKGMVFGSTTIIMEMYVYRYTSSPPSLFSLTDTAQVDQIYVTTQNDGSILVSRWGSNPAADLIAQTAPDLIRQGTWYHVGWKVFLHPTAGSVEVRLNGATVINVTGIKTTATTLPWSGAVGSF